MDDELLRGVTTFPKLVAYLRDELEWPIEERDFGDLTFDYEPEELGLDPKTAVKIRSIKQLRPLTTNQPWGIFFVEFERKRLTVVVMRRILSALALKKRASAGKSGQAAWQERDLLFISSYGEDGGRGITFAHFAPDEEGHDLPALKVLGWDGDDTKLHTQAVAQSLVANLTWPPNESDADQWRARWTSGFELVNREVAETSRELSIQLAKLAVGIRERAKALLASESDRGPLRKLHKAFKEALLHDLDQNGFADMYAQTVAYGLLAARLENPDSVTPITASAFIDMIPPTSPFLKGLLSTFLQVGGRRGYLDFDELGIDDVVDLLRKAKMKAILLDFGDLKPDEDPVLHFYELFLDEYNHAQKMQRGVFYTPKPVVHHIVRSIDEILRAKFGLTDGLADNTTWGEMAARGTGFAVPKGVAPSDPFVQVLDPATGTATFLVETIDVIYNTMVLKWTGQGKSKSQIASLWNEYVPLHLLPRLYGFEIQMSPYIIAHIKLGLKLEETGYHFASNERARVYLTNTLEEPEDYSDLLGYEIAPIAREARDVASVKRTLVATVVLGNPPYSGVSANMQPAARKIVAPYRFVDGVLIKEKGALQFEKNLNEDYVKFIRWSEAIVEKSVGIFSMITNNGYLDTATLRGMRFHLKTTFSSIQIIDLHGDADRRETADDGSPDENIFANVKHGVAVATMVREPPGKVPPSGIHIVDLKGSRKMKYEVLKRSIGGQLIGGVAKCRGPHYLFRVVDDSIEAEYLGFEALDSVFASGCTGFESGKDEVLTGFSRHELSQKLHDFAVSAEPDVRERYHVTGAWGFHVFSKRTTIAEDDMLQEHLRPFLFAPFDVRWCYYRRDLLKTNSYSSARHLMNGANLALVAMRQVSLDGSFSHVLCTDVMPNNRCMYSTKGKAAFFPLLLHARADELLGDRDTISQSNLQKAIIERVSSRTGCNYAETRTSSKAVTWTAEDLLQYVMAVTSSSLYRSRYDKPLRLDYLRIPLPGDVDLFFALVELGRKVVACQLLHIEAGATLVRLLGNGSSTVDHVAYDADRQRVLINQSQWFDNVLPDVWEYRIGGYQVCQKWLKDRGPKSGESGRVLSPDDVLHYRKMVAAITTLIGLQSEIDRIIVAAGGFPGAFSQGEA